MTKPDGNHGAVQMVVFVGAESTGKSTLVEYLAHEYDTVFVPEIGRFVWEEKNGVLDVDDYVAIAEMHRQAEDEALGLARGYLFVDTNALTTLLLGICYGQIDTVPTTLLDYADDCKTRYAHHFVCADDIPFEQDGWRENEAWRSRIQQLVLDDLKGRGIAYTVLRGPLAERAALVGAVLAAGATGSLS